MTIPRPHPHRKQGVPSDIVRRLSGGSQASGRGAPGIIPLPRAPGRLPAPVRRINVPVPWVVRPPEAREINIDASDTGFNAGNTPQVIAGSAFSLPSNHVGVLRSIVLSVNTLLPTSALTWTVRFNQIDVEGWQGLTIFPRNAGSVSVAYGPDETMVMVPESTAIDVEINVLAADANTYQAGVTYHGWSYPKRLADTFAGLYRL